LQQVGSYPRYTGDQINAAAAAARDPTLTQVIDSDLLVCFNRTVEPGSAMYKDILGAYPGLSWSDLL
jgi:hypothetical protein